MTDQPASGLAWVPEACTLPTAEQPLRLAEFDALFTAAVRGSTRLSPTHLRLQLTGDPDLEAVVRDLTVRESECCSFFMFGVDANWYDMFVGLFIIFAVLLERIRARTSG